MPVSHVYLHMHIHSTWPSPPFSSSHRTWTVKLVSLSSYCTYLVTYSMSLLSSRPPLTKAPFSPSLPSLTLPDHEHSQRCGRELYTSVRPSVRRSSSRRAYDIRILIDVLLHAPRSAMEGGKEGKREAEGGKQADTAVRQAARQPASSRSLLQSPLSLPLRLHERRRRRGASEPLLLFPLLRLCRVPQRHFPTEMIGGRVNATSRASEGSPRATTLSARRPR